MKPHNIFCLKNKNVLLTGSTGYLGESMAWGLAEAGANVLLNSRSEMRCANLVDRIRVAGLLAETAIFDVTDTNEIEGFFASRGSAPLHCLINNAYSGGSGTIKTSNTDSYLKSYEITVLSAHNLLIKSLRALRLAVKECGDASVVNIATMYGVVSPDLRVYENPEVSNPPFYGSAKAGLLQWTKYAACEFGVEGIRVNSISPGPFPSTIVQNTNPDFVKKLANRVPLQRIGRPHEVKGALILLASSASTYINGANIAIDGGWTCW